jgi:hypothetical protein
MRIPPVLLLLLGCLFVTSHGLAAEEPVLELPVLKVMPGFFDYLYHCKNARITLVKITGLPANTATHRAGLRKGDQLVAIDGVKVVGLSRPEFERLIDAKLEIGDSKRFTFLKSKGFIVRLNKTFDITYTAHEKLNPTQSES